MHLKYIARVLSSLGIVCLKGYHDINANGDIISSMAVNIHRDELLSDYVDYKTLADNAPSNVIIISMDSAVDEHIRQAQIGVEIWRQILFIIIILLIIEMLISNVNKKS